MLDVGLNSPNNKFVICNKCKTPIIANGIRWCRATRFIKKKSSQFTNQKENINIILKPKELLKELIAN